MRKIKFRGKVRKTEFFETVNDTYPINKDYWVYGWLVKDADGKTFILPADETHVDDKDNKLYFDGVPIIPEVDPETVCQYTGLKDKNGQEIYEGDVVRRTEVYNKEWATVAIVCYRQETAQFVLHNDEEYVEDLPLVSTRNYDDGQISFILEYEYEIIGNIHDNPELLKE